MTSAENGFPPYVSRSAKTGNLQYYRRPPTGVKGSAFVRAFGTKDRAVMLVKYSPVHAEAEAYFERLRTGRTLTDQELLVLTATHKNLDAMFRERSGDLNSREDWEEFIDQFGSEQMKALTGPDRDRLIVWLNGLYAGSESVQVQLARMKLEQKEEYFKERFDDPHPPTPGQGLTLMKAYEQAWLPAGNRSNGTIAETKRFVEDFITLNGDHALTDLTREHWAKWRADCLERHGAGWTAFKRFTMLKTVVNETIKAGLLERKFHTGQDVVLTKPPRSKLRNEGWSDDELKTLFTSEWFTLPNENPARYWIPTIIAFTGARLSEVAHMQVADVDQRHGLLTFYLARDEGKTEDSRRIIPIPKTILDLGFMTYLKTRPKNGPLFDTTARKFTKRFGDYRRKLGLVRRGCDLHAFRHHIKTVLDGLGCTDRVSDYITGHAPPNEGRRYGKAEYEKALEHLNRIDLRVTIPKWNGG
jgi:integrase